MELRKTSGEVQKSYETCCCIVRNHGYQEYIGVMKE